MFNSYHPQFQKITSADFLPEIRVAIAQALEAVNAISACPDAPTFANTIEALEHADDRLSRVLSVFYPLLSANADDQMNADALTVSALLSEYSAKVAQNEVLFNRIRTLHDAPPEGLTAEQQTLLTNSYLGFTRAGALLPTEQKKQIATIKARISKLSTKFGQNVKKELAQYRFELGPEEVEGLPEWLVEEAAQRAKEEGSKAPYMLTLDAPVYMAFMRFSPFNELRHRLLMMYASRNQEGEFDNTAILREIANLRLQMAQILGYPSFAHFKLERTMARTPERVTALLNELHEAYREPLRKELEELTEFAGEEITPWNYAYHSNRLLKARYDFDPEEMRPYLELNRVIEGVFGLAHRLYGITLTQRTDLPLYHHDVKTFDVVDTDGSTLGVLYADFFPRAPHKSPGAWMTEFCEADEHTRPIVNIVMNFTKPGADRPSLLTPDEVRTLLHEFGHALHALLTRAKYRSLAGTSVFRDFVELPSQFNENFLTEPEFMRSFAVHYLTGEPIPQSLIDRLQRSENFGAAYACLRQLGFGTLDMAWHSITEPTEASVADFEHQALEQIAIFPTLDDRALTSPTFGHIFSGGYAAGYYSYKWSEVLDADAFALFRERGTFDPATAASFRREILERGGTEPPELLYRRFRGRDATAAALLARTLPH